MIPAISVSTLNNRIKSLLETTFLSVAVEGEVSRVTYHGSGHLYFTLKDASSSISCVMFKGNNQKLKFRLEEGMKIIVYGSISVYTPRGSYQINCTSLEPSGSGALALAFEQLKKKLSSKGYFNDELKKPVAKFPKAVAIITSKTGAALQDMLRVAQKRWPLLKIILIDTLVQGENAAEDIAKNIAFADTLNVDVIVVGRGGGSLEDLWAFNEEIVADAIYKAKTPVVSAVGHEIDFMISDFTADLRAPTPSAAFEMILPDKNEYLIYIDNLIDSMEKSIKRILVSKYEKIKYLYDLFKQNSIATKISFFKKEIHSIEERLKESLSLILEKKQRELNDAKELLFQKASYILQRKEQILSLAVSSLEINNPSKKIKKGFAQIVKNGKIIDLEDIEEEDMFELISKNVKIEAKAVKKSSL
ncbi:MAG: exodeoxyribonuclease VII large subunit [Epsilonproteobacteria bacterium]|nr:exodeoxyribonuclease VII large subunit [Campylobacterota bacterium]